MKIVVLDGFTLNPGDLSWDELENLGECRFYERSAVGEVPGRVGGAQAVFTNKVAFDGATLKSLPDLRYIGITATGTNIVDLDVARTLGITVTNVPSYGAAAIAQSAFALLLELTNHIGHYDQAVRDGKWHASPDFCFWDRKIVALMGLTMGIVGLGSIGTEVAKLAQAFGMKLLVHTRTPRTPEGLQVEFCGLDELFSRSDVISLHCALAPETREMVNAKRLAMMKPSAFFLNISRGLLVNEQDLADALNAGKIAGAALDVLSSEPPRGENPLLAAKNCIVTPHIAWASHMARKKLMDIAVDNLRQFLKGQPVNVVNS